MLGHGDGEEDQQPTGESHSAGISQKKGCVCVMWSEAEEIDFGLLRRRVSELEDVDVFIGQAVEWSVDSGSCMRCPICYLEKARLGEKGVGGNASKGML